MDNTGIVAEIIEMQLKAVWSMTGPNPPMCSGCEPRVQIFAGDHIPLDSVGNSPGCGCGEPFLWIRFARRFHSKSFPKEDPNSSGPCGGTVGVQFEVGIARCVATGEMTTAPLLSERRREAYCTFDDAWRMDKALCRAGSIAVRDNVALDYSISAGSPEGPEGGLVVWVQTIQVQLSA